MLREIAKEIYRLQQEVEALQNKFGTVPEGKQDDIEHQLRKAKTELLRLRRALDGQLDR